MDEETTTSSVVDDTASNDSQPVADNTNDEAVTETSETSQTSDAEETGPQADNSEDTDIKEWAAKKNLPLDDPMKIAKMYRESEKELGRKGQEAGQLAKASETASESLGVDDLQATNNRLSVLEFYTVNPEARDYDGKMAEILNDKPYLAQDLDTLYVLAKARTAEAELLAARQAGKKDALSAAAQAEQAGAPKATATTRETPKAVSDEEIGNMTPVEYATWRQNNNPFRP